MVSSVVALLACALSASLIPSSWADHCKSYTGLDGRHHIYKMCFLNEFCCGSCAHRHCCDYKALEISEEEQDRCPEWPSFQKKPSFILTFAYIIGAGVLVLIFVGLIICLVNPHCMLYRKCRNRSQQGQVVTTVVNPALQPVTPHGYHPPYPGYQPVPVHPGPGGLHNPGAPPLYVGPSDPMPPSYPVQLYGPPPSEPSQPPYNPAYNPNS